MSRESHPDEQTQPNLTNVERQPENLPYLPTYPPTYIHGSIHTFIHSYISYSHADRRIQTATQRYITRQRDRQQTRDEANKYYNQEYRHTSRISDNYIVRHEINTARQLASSSTTRTFSPPVSQYSQPVQSVSQYSQPYSQSVRQTLSTHSLW